MDQIKCLLVFLLVFTTPLMCFAQTAEPALPRDSKPGVTRKPDQVLSPLNDEEKALAREGEEYLQKVKKTFPAPSKKLQEKWSWL